MRSGGRAREREYEFHRGPVLRMLAKRFPRLDEDDRLALYHDAWGRVLEKRRAGEEIVSLRAYLMASAACDALHSVSRGRAPVPVGPDDPRLSQLVDERTPLDEEVVRRDQARIARDVLDTLDERQRQVLKLRWDLQLTGAEVRAALGLSRRQYRRLSAEGATAVAERVEALESGEWSARTRSLLVACVVEVDGEGEARRGIASRRQRDRARRLVESDPHAAALFAELRRTLGTAAALVPMPALAVPPGSQLDRLAAALADLRGAVASSLDVGKQHATATYLRAADPAVLSGNPRPGAAAAAVVAGAVALGGGAYGAFEVVTPPDRSPAPPSAGVSPLGATPATPSVADSPATPSAAPVTTSAATAARPPEPRPAPPDLSHSTEFTPESTPPPTPTPPQPTQPQPKPTEFGFEN